MNQRHPECAPGDGAGRAGGAEFPGAGWVRRAFRGVQHAGVPFGSSHGSLLCYRRDLFDRQVFHQRLMSTDSSNANGERRLPFRAEYW